MCTKSDTVFVLLTILSLTIVKASYINFSHSALRYINSGYFEKNGFRKSMSITEFEDPLAKNQVKTGYITVQTQSSKDRIFYSYWMKPNSSVKNGKRPPLVIANPGGPGIAAESLLITSGGPFNYNLITGGFKNALPKDTYFDKVDVLLPDIPGGTGFSTTQNYNKPIEEILESVVKFFTNLAQEDSEIDLKNREIIMYGISYGGGILSYVARSLRNKKFNIKGLLLDSPWAAPHLAAEDFRKIMLNYNIMKDTKLKQMGKRADECANSINKQYKMLYDRRDNIKNDFKFTTAMGQNCDDLYNNSKHFIEDGKLVANGYDLDKSSNVS